MMNVIRMSHFFFFKQKTAYEMRISDWSSDVCSSDLGQRQLHDRGQQADPGEAEPDRGRIPAEADRRPERPGRGIDHAADLPQEPRQQQRPRAPGLEQRPERADDGSVAQAERDRKSVA